MLEIKMFMRCYIELLHFVSLNDLTHIHVVKLSYAANVSSCMNIEHTVIRKTCPCNEYPLKTHQWGLQG